MNRIAQQVYDLALPVAEAQGVEIWDVEYVKEAGQWFLRVYIDKDGGIGIDDCEAFSRALDPVLDEQASRLYGLTVDRHELTFYGTCQKCMQKRSALCDHCFKCYRQYVG